MSDANRTSDPDDPALTQPAAGPPDWTLPLASGYEIGEEIGRGGMGVVYRARDLSLDREVAVKLLQDRYAPTSGTAVRFVEEARITGRLQHPGIPAVYHVGIWVDGRPFLAMKLIRGKTLSQHLKDEGPDPTRWLGAFEGVCHAVGFAHSKGIIHRDLKPPNVMVGAFGEVQVMDWGLAKVLSETARTTSPPVAPELHTGSWRESPRPSDGSATLAGSVLGTPAYMPPEQAAGEVEKVDRRADVFGLGAMLCALLTGQPPYSGDSVEAVRIAAVRGDTAAALRRLDASGADPDVVALCKRCLAFEPSDRPADANAVATEVARIRAAADDRARRAEQERLEAEVRSAEQVKRRRVIEWAGAAVAIVLAAGVTVALWQAKVARREAFDAELARGTAEHEKKQADAARDAAEAAGRQVTAQLARTAATAADLAAKRGAWDEAIRQYAAALALGAEDPVRLKVGRVVALAAQNQMRRAVAELDELSASADLGPYRGRVLLLQADYSLVYGRDGSTPPEEFARRAAAAGLPPADAAYARVFDAKTVLEALDHTKEALKHDPDHTQALNLTVSLAWLVGRRADAHDAHARLRFLLPGSTTTTAGAAYMAALDGNRAEVERLTTAFAVGEGKAAAPMFRMLAELILDMQNEDVLLTGLPLEQRVKVLNAMNQLASLNGERAVAEMYMFRLPMFRALGKLPVFQKLTDANPLAAIGLLGSPDALIDILAGISGAVPDGTLLMNYGAALAQAGRHAEAEAVLGRALEATSFANHRKACLFHRMTARDQLARKVSAEQAAWRQKTHDDLRALAECSPLPWSPAMFAFDAAYAQGDHALALGFVDAALSRDPKNKTLRAARVRALLRYGSLARAEQDARDLLAVVAEGNDAREAIDLLELIFSTRASPDTAGVALGQFILRERAKRYGPDDSDAGPAHYYLGRTYIQNGDPDAAVPHFVAFLASERKRAAGKPDEFAWMLRGIATTLTNAGRPADAVSVLREYVAVADADAKAGRKLPSEMPVEARWLLGLALWQTGSRDEAARLLTAAHPDLAAACARIEDGAAFRIYVSRDDVRRLVRNLIDHHAAAGRTAEAAAWRAKLPPEIAPPPRLKQPEK